MAGVTQHLALREFRVAAMFCPAPDLVADLLSGVDVIDLKALV
jgi:hypothetical protein